MTTTSELSRDLSEDPRFDFGENWTRFLSALNDERIQNAADGLAQMLEVTDLQGKTLLDVGSGSGLFSLAARKLGAKVVSFDIDPKSVACTAELKKRFFEADPHWRIEHGSALDDNFLKGLGQFDVVYSWGVLHHTGALWKALSNADACVASGGKIFIALYNDQGRKSRVWLQVKRLYGRLPTALRGLVLIPCFVLLWGPPMLRDLLIGKPFVTWRAYAKNRGMSAWHDLVDWVGGYPFEVSSPQQVFEFFKHRNYRLTALKTCAGAQGCNEYVFQRDSQEG